MWKWGRLLIAFLMLPGSSLGAEPEIHRCIQDNGTVAFQDMPCADSANDSDGGDQSGSGESGREDDAFEFANPFGEGERTPAIREPGPPTTLSSDRAECEKTTRDAIDAIDVELRQNYATEARQAYLGRLLKLTKQLRDCKQL